MTDITLHAHLNTLVDHNPVAALEFIASRLTPSPNKNFPDLVTLELDQIEIVLLICAARRAIHFIGGPHNYLPVTVERIITDIRYLEAHEGGDYSRRQNFCKNAAGHINQVERVSVFGYGGGNYANL